ncbi:MAG TPA: DUF427 domain-containing protein [Stellaceae bacterium]|nr:DUF427 domain-containing protein [Stellaceae bacterium]
MKAILKDRVIADSHDIVTVDGYAYFPRAAVHTEWLEKAPKTASDLECPHGVQFYDVVVDGGRHPRAAWCYEAPLPRMKQVADRFGFWEDVEVR